MTFKKYRPIVVCAAVWLSGCSFVSDSLWPSLSGEDPAGNTSRAGVPEPVEAGRPAPRPIIAAQRPPALGTTIFKAPGVTPGQSTGTFVGQQVVELRKELRRLQSNVSQNNKRLQGVRSKTVQDSQRYHGAVSAINARLQVGTTPGNPILIEQFNQALANLDKISEDISQMNGLTTGVTADSTLAAFLAENTRAAFRLSGAVDEDHRQLAILEDEVNRTVVLIDRLLKELGEDIQRQTIYVSTERSNLNTLSASIKSGEILGASLANRMLGSAPRMASRMPLGSRSTLGRRPLVVIRFDRKDVAYEQALYNAVSRALERRPNATFELVAVAPAQGGTARVALNATKARRNAENVMRALRGMGLPPQRTTISARTSRAARTNEVHLFIN